MSDIRVLSLQVHLAKPSLLNISQKDGAVCVITMSTSCSDKIDVSASLLYVGDSFFQ